VRALRAIEPGIEVAGLGGRHFSSAGGRLIDDYRALSVTGLTEAIAKIPRSWATLRRLVAAARTDRPDALVVLDFPDFNLPLSRQVAALGIPVVYYISPQIWAWRPGRVRTIRDVATIVLVIFPFEEAMYRERGVPVEFVGHPLIELTERAGTRDGGDSRPFRTRHGLPESVPIVAILPGSRANEVKRILPDLIAAAELIRAWVTDARFVLARAPGLDDRLFEPAWTGRVPVTIIEGQTDAVLAASAVALTASGTATVQAALHDTPMVIVYRVSPLTYRLGRRLVTIDTFGMVNLIAGEHIAPELIQDAFTPAAVADEAVSLLTDPARVARVRHGLARVRERLGPPGASRRAADAILRVARSRSPRGRQVPNPEPL
jgi:lipid-A-disaccharide synthase